MVRDRFDHNRGEAPDYIDHECIFVQDRGGYLILIPGDCESIPEAAVRRLQSLRMISSA